MPTITSNIMAIFYFFVGYSRTPHFSAQPSERKSEITPNFILHYLEKIMKYYLVQGVNEPITPNFNWKVVGRR